MRGKKKGHCLILFFFLPQYWYFITAVLVFNGNIFVIIIKPLIFPNFYHSKPVIGPPKMDRSWRRVLTQCDPLEKGMANHLHIHALRTPWRTWKDKVMALKDELPRSVGAQYATGDQWRNNSRKNEEMVPKQKQNPFADVIGDRSLSLML